MTLASVARGRSTRIVVVIRQHRSLIFQDSDERAFQQPALGGVPESAIIRAIDQEAFPSNHTL
jgi:hypothetical protein